MSKVTLPGKYHNRASAAYDARKLNEAAGKNVWKVGGYDAPGGLVVYRTRWPKSHKSH